MTDSEKCYLSKRMVCATARRNSGIVISSARLRWHRVRMILVAHLFSANALGGWLATSKLQQRSAGHRLVLSQCLDRCPDGCAWPTSCRKPLFQLSHSLLVRCWFFREASNTFQVTSGNIGGMHRRRTCSPFEYIYSGAGNSPAVVLWSLCSYRLNTAQRLHYNIFCAFC